MIELSIVTIHIGPKEPLIMTVNSLSQLTSLNKVEHVLVINDSSKLTKDISDEIESKNTNIIITKDNGPFDAMNIGLRNCRGKWIWYVNSGDLFTPDFDSKKILEILQDSEKPIVYGNMIYLYGDGTKRIIKRRELKKPYNLTFSHPSTIIRTDLLKSVNGFKNNFRYCADYDLFLNLALKKIDNLYVDNIFVSMNRDGISSNLSLFMTRTKEHYCSAKYHNGLFHAIYECSSMVMVGMPKLIARNALTYFRKLNA